MGHHDGSGFVRCSLRPPALGLDGAAGQLLADPGSRVLLQSADLAVHCGPLGPRELALHYVCWRSPGSRCGNEPHWRESGAAMGNSGRGREPGVASGPRAGVACLG